MRAYECQTCDSVEVLSMFPDGCSTCGGRLVCLNGVEPDPWDFLDDIADDLLDDTQEPEPVQVEAHEIVEYAPPRESFGSVFAAYAIVAALALGALYMLGRDGDAAMERCEQHQSFETCFLALNR